MSSLTKDYRSTPPTWGSMGVANIHHDVGRRMFMTRQVGALGMVAVCLLGPATTDAHQSEGVRATVKTVTCRFSVSATGTWTKGEPQADVKPAELSLRFESINTDEGTARAIGNFGPS